MSRCFPYPPHGYAGKCSSNEALILSIKLQREREQAKSDRKKERKREKKEKRREEEKVKGKADSEKRIPEEKLCYDAVIKTQLKGGSNPGKREDELELLEKSGVTEEHGPPCYSSDSTENSTKRKRPLAPPNSIQGHGNILRIRLSSQKRENPTGSSGKKQLCSTSGRPESLAQQESRIDFNQFHNLHHFNPKASTAASHLAPKSDRVVPPLPGKTAAVTSIAAQIGSKPERVVPPLRNRAFTSTSSTALHLPSKPDRVVCPLPMGEAAETSPTLPLPSKEAIPGRTAAVTSITAQIRANPERADASTSTAALHLPPKPDKVASSLLDKTAGITNTATLHLNQGPDRLLPVLPERTETAVASHAASKSSDKKMRRELKYRKLIDSWVPPPLEFELSEPDELDWLFASKEQGQPVAKRFKACDDLPCRGSTTALQPRAEYLQDVDTYALPFTLPF
ncbi:hypothetical protein Ancab_016766 [Ancistrocladus abbreviatus]